MSNVVGPLGIDPVAFALCLFGLLLLFVLYLLLPRAVRVHYMNAYPKRYTWAAKPRRRRHTSSVTSVSGDSASAASRSSGWFGRGRAHNFQQRSISNPSALSPPMEEMVDFGERQQPSISMSASHVSMSASHDISLDSGAHSNQINNHDEKAIIHETLNSLRSEGVVIIAHGSRGKPKTVRLQLTSNAITWRTESQKRKVPGTSRDLKLGKLHSVSLSNIMYVDVGKQTAALKRVDNKNISESLCFSLLTKEGSLDLESSSPRERDALVGAFSLVLDNVHNQRNLNWRDNQAAISARSASRDVPSSFDDFSDVA